MFQMSLGHAAASPVAIDAVQAMTSNPQRGFAEVYVASPVEVSRVQSEMLIFEGARHSVHPQPLAGKRSKRYIF